jgi:hypothetical protein
MREMPKYYGNRMKMRTLVVLCRASQSPMMKPMNTGTDSTGAHIEGVPERRGTGRFPVREDIRYRVVQSRTTKVSGCGTTLNIGSGGILFTTEDKLPLGRMVELSVNWPAKLDGVCPLQFAPRAGWFGPTPCEPRFASKDMSSERGAWPA